MSHALPLETPLRRSSADSVSGSRIVPSLRQRLIRTGSVAVLVLGFHGTTRASDFDCHSVEYPTSGSCKEAGCEKRRVGPNQGFCATAKEFIVRDLQPGEQMCCTADKAIVQQVPSKGILVCNATEAKVLYPDEQELATCLKKAQSRRECVPQACCMIKRCEIRIEDETKGERLLCADLRIVPQDSPIRSEPYLGVACNSVGCAFTTSLDPKPDSKGRREQFACKRFTGDPKDWITVKPDTPHSERDFIAAADRSTCTGENCPIKGPTAAPVTVVEFSDFQCPYCVGAEKTVKALMESEEYRGKIRLVYRDLPLQGHALAAKAAEATHCAADQGRYWQMHDKLFENSPKLEVSELKNYARGIGLDAVRFDTCLDSGAKAGVVLDQTLMAEQMGVDATPAFFINGQLLTGTQPLEAFKFVIDGELAARGTKAATGVQTTPEGTRLHALGTQ